MTQPKSILKKPGNRFFRGTIGESKLQLENYLKKLNPDKISKWADKKIEEKYSYIDLINSKLGIEPKSHYEEKLSKIQIRLSFYLTDIKENLHHLLGKANRVKRISPDEAAVLNSEAIIHAAKLKEAAFKVVKQFKIKCDRIDAMLKYLDKVQGIDDEIQHSCLFLCSR